MADFPLPLPDEDTQEFWDGCAREQFLLQECDACTALRYPPRPMCPACNAWTFRWRPASGRATLYSYTITHQALHPTLADKLPHVVILAELEEGPRVTSVIEACAPDALVVGMPLTLTFGEMGGMTLPRFRPASPADAG